MKQNSLIVTILAFFTSCSTLFCCALPIILVSLGFGAVSSSLISNYAFITILAEYSITLFILAFILLSLSGYLLFFKVSFCPANPEYAKICLLCKKTAKIMWFISLFILFVAIFFKYILILLI